MRIDKLKKLAGVPLASVIKDDILRKEILTLLADKFHTDLKHIEDCTFKIDEIFVMLKSSMEKELKRRALTGNLQRSQPGAGLEDLRKILYTSHEQKKLSAEDTGYPKILAIESYLIEENFTLHEAIKEICSEHNKDLDLIAFPSKAHVEILFGHKNKEILTTSFAENLINFAIYKEDKKYKTRKLSTTTYPRNKYIEEIFAYEDNYFLDSDYGRLLAPTYA